MPRLHDLVIVGGGPAGLGVAIAAARRGLEVLLLERGTFPADKACGEGLLPAGVRALEALGVRSLLDPSAFSPLRAIRWIDGDVVAEARLPAPGGLGIRRTALSVALLPARRGPMRSKSTSAMGSRPTSRPPDRAGWASRSCARALRGGGCRSCWGTSPPWRIASPG